MSISMLERRAHPRRHADHPLTLRYDGADQAVPAHLLDISCAGAALLTTSHNAPELGQYLHLQFETPTNDGAVEGRPREELAVVINIRRPEREVIRVGVRFIHRLELGTSPPAPQGLIDDYLTTDKSGLTGDRWSFLKRSVRRGGRAPQSIGAR
jgi:hypothetical protein